jgi:hypothetical protein
MACKSCEQRRILMRIMAEAGKEWAEKPMGPTIRAIYLRMKAEAQERGELDNETD